MKRLMSLMMLSAGLAACTEANPVFGADWTVRLQADMGVGGEDLKPVSCPPMHATGSTPGFHPDADRCKDSFCYRSDNSPVSSKSCVWGLADPEHPIVLVYQESNEKKVGSWRLMPGNDMRLTQSSNTFYQFGENVTAIYSRLAENDAYLPWFRERIDFEKRQVIMESCPGTNGLCTPWANVTPPQ